MSTKELDVPEDVPEDPVKVSSLPGINAATMETSMDPLPSHTGTSETHPMQPEPTDTLPGKSSSNGKVEIFHYQRILTYFNQNNSS